jgi:hypothetical protein
VRVTLRSKTENSKSAIKLLQVVLASAPTAKTRVFASKHAQRRRSGNGRGGTDGIQEPQWPSRREGALARTGLIGTGAGACVAVGPTAAIALVLGQRCPESLKPTRSRASFAMKVRGMLHTKLLSP